MLQSAFEDASRNFSAQAVIAPYGIPMAPSRADMNEALGRQDEVGWEARNSLSLDEFYNCLTIVLRHDSTPLCYGIG
jgi:hypothetical protein